MSEAPLVVALGRQCKTCGADEWRVKSRRCAPCHRRMTVRSEKRRVAWDPRFQLYKGAVDRARRRGIDISITLDDIVIPDVCPVLGIPMERSRGRWNEGSPSLDRLDNTKGYTKDNVRVISHRANRLKSNATASELEAIAAWLRKEQG